MVRQVHGVRDRAEVDQRPRVQPAPRPAAGARHGGMQQPGDRQALQRVARGLAEGLVAPDEGQQQRGQAQPDDDTFVPHAARRAVHRLRRKPGVAPQREQAADQDGIDAGVGGHRQVLHRHALAHQPDTPCEHRHAQPGQHQRGAAAAARAQQQQGQRRVEEVEVLLDGQRPDHAQARGQAVEILRDDEVVAEVEQRRGEAPRREGAVDHAQRRQCRGERDDDHQRRHQPQQPAQVEAAEVDAAGARMFLAHQRGDEEAAEHEEDRHAQAAGDESFQPAVREEHQRHRQRADAVQAGDGGRCVAVRRRAGVRRAHAVSTGHARAAGSPKAPRSRCSSRLRASAVLASVMITKSTLSTLNQCVSDRLVIACWKKIAR